MHGSAEVVVDRAEQLPTAPEPLASHCHFYDDEQLAELARRAGLGDVAVCNDNGGQLLTARR